VPVVEVTTIVVMVESLGPAVNSLMMMKVRAMMTTHSFIHDMRKRCHRWWQLVEAIRKLAI